MTEQSSGPVPVAKQRRVSDPDNVSVKVIDGLVSCGILGTSVAMTLTQHRLMIGPDGALDPDTVIAARLRFDLEVAILIRDALNNQIKVLTVQQERPN